MRLENIHYFIEVADCGSINKAAKKCFITQQGLSRIIASMEKELCVQLFQRDGKILRLTPSGEFVLKGFREVEKTYTNTLGQLSVLSERYNENRQNYTIFATPVICITCLNRILNDVSSRFPSVNFNVVERNITDILERIDYDKNTIGIASASSFFQKSSERLQNKSVVFDRCFSDVLRCSVHESNPISSKSVITAQELSKLSLVCHNTEILMAKRMLGTLFNPALVTNTTNHSLCRSIVNQGFSVGFTSAIIEHYRYDDNAIVTIPFEQTIRIDYGCIYNCADQLGQIGRAILKAVRSELSGIHSL